MTELNEKITLPHEIDRSILAAIPRGHIIYGRALAKELDIPYKILCYHIRNCLTDQIVITLPYKEGKPIHIKKSQKEIGGFKK